MNKPTETAFHLILLTLSTCVIHHIIKLQKSSCLHSNKPVINWGNLCALRRKIIVKLVCLIVKLKDQVNMNEVKSLLTLSPRHNKALN